jgi:hypothetical protein
MTVVYTARLSGLLLLLLLLSQCCSLLLLLLVRRAAGIHPLHGLVSACAMRICTVQRMNW